MANSPTKTTTTTPNQSPTPTIYFGYGSNLWLHQMRTRCPSSHYLGIGLLPNHKWIINQRGYANVVQLPSTPSTPTSTSTNSPTPTHVYALIFSLTPTDESRLDANEGVPTAYTKAHLRCSFWPGTLDSRVDTSLPPQETDRMMLVYVDRERTVPGRPRDEYVYRMNRGIEDAVRLGVPQGYVDEVMRGFIPREEDEGEGEGEGEGERNEVEKLARTQAERFRDESGVF